MIGETNYGYCFRENELWYQDVQDGPCKMPLKDGNPCGDSALGGPRCPYSRRGPDIDFDKLIFITYPQCNKKK